MQIVKEIAEYLPYIILSLIQIVLICKGKHTEAQRIENKKVKELEKLEKKRKKVIAELQTAKELNKNNEKEQN